MKVYFTDKITSESILDIYKKLGIELKGKVAVKVHSGEEGNQNYLKPLFYKDLIDYVNGTVVECNTAYNGERNTSEKHLKLLDKHEWTKYYNVDLLDEIDEVALEVKNTKYIICFGETKQRIKEFADSINIPCEVVNDIKEAVPLAYKLSLAKDIILLSPACASWDQYKCFEDRGQDFKERVNELK